MNPTSSLSSPPSPRIIIAAIATAPVNKQQILIASIVVQLPRIPCASASILLSSAAAHVIVHTTPILLHHHPSHPHPHPHHYQPHPALPYRSLIPCRPPKVPLPKYQACRGLHVQRPSHVLDLVCLHVCLLPRPWRRPAFALALAFALASCARSRLRARSRRRRRSSAPLRSGSVRARPSLAYLVRVYYSYCVIHRLVRCLCNHRRAL
ncbi:hypothetical protein C2E23DRAFT_516428 [Lenzites betulinus]|nr:hypothetical protein C2E23DRAFT_516428 [Lenzites betulinus]